MKSMYQIQQGDCLELMRSIPDKSIDMILADLPYGTTACSWDTIIPFEPLWDNYKRIIKPNGCIALFGSEPFSSYLRLSNIGQYRYDWIWHKNASGSFVLARNRPMKYHENVSIFYELQPSYNPQMQSYSESMHERFNKNHIKNRNVDNVTTRIHKMKRLDNSVFDLEKGKYPESVQFFKSVHNNSGERFHPSQKPLDLLEYLILTYTNENETVLDNTMGSGSTGVACIRTNRNFIGYEKDSNYFSIAEKRILEEIDKTSLFNSLGGRQDRISA